MTKTLLTIVTVVMLILFTSAASTSVIDSRIGHEAPMLEIEGDSTHCSLQHFRGSYVLVSFWSSTNAASRVANIRYENINHIAINFDRTEGLFQEICRIDALEPTSQFYCNDNQRMKIINVWRQDSEFSTFLINPEGEIVDINPEINELAKI